MSDIELLNLPIADIEFKDRARENYKDLDVLAKDIEQKGIIQPIAVMRLTSGKYRLLAGGRRFSAFVLTDKPSIPCRVYPATLTDLDQSG